MDPPKGGDWGIPVLDPAMQAERLTEPTERWGGIPRSRHMPGTYHFYTADRLFAGLVKRPGTLINSGCYATAEVNFSSWRDQPRIEVAHNIYIKRRMARYWQSHGVRIWVDMAVDDAFWDIALWGVPTSWDAFATRKIRNTDLAYLAATWTRVRRHVDRDDFLYWVHGGTWATRDFCAARGWLWTPETASRAVGKAPPPLLTR